MNPKTIEGIISWIGENNLQLTIYRNLRQKNIILRLKENQLRVSCPFSTPQKIIHEFINMKKKWILKQIDRNKHRQDLIDSVSNNTSYALYLGKNIPLHINYAKKNSIAFRNNTFIIALKRNSYDRQNKIKRLLTSWYQKIAFDYLIDKTNCFIEKYKFKLPKSISVKSYRARWGSCSYQHDISLNWKLILLPEPVIDYVIIHELCHMLEFNHSPRFWLLVEQYIPNYSQSVNWLKDNDYLINSY